jgi:hypothetical protein
LKLCELGKECRAALDNDKISLGTAVLIARIPPSLQAEALRSIQGWWTAAQTKRELDVLFLLRLDQAPFDISNAELVPKAGACTACPKRTGQQRELFPDAVRADLCTDRVCYRGKLDAVWKIRVKEAKAGGTAVIEGKAAQKAFGYGSGYTRLDGEEYFGGKYQKVRAVFGKTLPPITLARDDKSGGIVELVRSADVAKLTKERTSTNDYNARTGMSKREEQRIKLRAAAVDMAIAWAVERTSRLDGGQLVRLITHAMIERAWDEVQKTVIRRRGLEEAKGKTKRVNSTTAERLLLTYLKTLTKPADVAGLALEVALREVAPGKWKTPTPIWGDTLKALGIKFEDIEKTVAAEAKAKKKAKEKKPKKTPRAPKVRTCSKCGCTDEAACPGGCAWASRNPDICSSCV